MKIDILELFVAKLTLLWLSLIHLGSYLTTTRPLQLNFSREEQMSELPKIVIPSYKRSRRCLTLAFLKKQMYPPHLIYLFVADEEEEKAYLRDVHPSEYGHLIVGKKGLAAQRNFISEWLPQDEIVLQLDDDVKDIKILPENMSFTDLVLKGVAEVKKGGLFGILPNDDGRKLKNDTTYHLTHILGAFFIYTNDKAFVLEHDEKEDYARSIYYFKKYGKVARYRGAGVKTTYHKGEGGLNAEGREARMKIGAEALVKMYPGYCKEIVKKGKADIQLNWRAKKMES